MQQCYATHTHTHTHAHAHIHKPAHTCSGTLTLRTCTRSDATRYEWSWNSTGIMAWELTPCWYDQSDKCYLLRENKYCIPLKNKTQQQQQQQEQNLNLIPFWHVNLDRLFLYTECQRKYNNMIWYDKIISEGKPCSAASLQHSCSTKESYN